MTISNKFVNTSARTIQELLQNRSKFTVPKFQRNYSWDEENVEALWNDLMDNFNIVRDNPDNSRDAQYLLGPIVLVSDDQHESFLVIDGQQRLSTITMLFCVTRDIIMRDADGQTTDTGKISELIENTRMGKHDSWKLTLNDTDLVFFQDIQKPESKGKSKLVKIKKRKDKTPSLKHLANNYEFLHDKITNSLYTNFGQDSIDSKDIDDEVQRKELRIKNVQMLHHFMNHVIENNYLIQIVVSDNTSAFQIFETLNERGESLSKSDLIKNHILNKVKHPDQQKILNDRWNGVFKMLAGMQKDDDFIMESYHSRKGDRESLREKTRSKFPMSKKYLYNIIKDAVVDEKSCETFVEELEIDAEFLSTLNEPVKYTYKNNDDAYAIKALRAKLIRMPILAAHRKWGDENRTEDYSLLTSLLVKFFFKTKTVIGAHPGKIEKVMFNITEMINKDKSLDEIKKKLLVEDDHEEFKRKFKHSFVISPSKDFARYALQMISIHLGDDKNDVVPLDNLTLEHVLPIKHEGKWKKKEFIGEYSGEIKINEFVDRLGNMTLLKSAINSKIRNLPFLEKKGKIGDKKEFLGYHGSPLNLNHQTIFKYDEWTANVIFEREEEFIKYADKIWKLE